MFFVGGRLPIYPKEPAENRGLREAAIPSKPLFVTARLTT